MQLRTLALFAAASSMHACGSASTSTVDASSSMGKDAAALDASSSADAGLDASMADAAVLDASSADGAQPDALAMDAAPADAAADAATPDAAAPDAAASDAAASDAAPRDTGASDAAPNDASTNTFAMLQAFDGDQGTGPTGRGRPEMNVAASGAQVAQITWQNVSVYDYTGHLLVRTPLPSLITAAGLNPISSIGYPFEPHIVFDEFIQRWIITATCQLDCVLVSDGPDLTTAQWAGFYLDGNGNDPAIHIGYDANGVYFSETVLTNPNPDTPCCSSNVFAIPSSELAWTTTLSPTHLNKQIGKPHEIMMLVDPNPQKSGTAPALFVARTCPAGNSCQGNASNPIVNQAFQWIVSSGTWSGATFTMTSNHTSVCAGGAAPSDQCLRTDPSGTTDLWLYNTPIDPDQPGSSQKLRAAEIHRILGAMQVGTTIEVALGSGPCVMGCAAHGMDFDRDIFVWAEIDCSNANACVIHQTQKASTSTYDLLWPTVGVDQSGNVGVFTNVVSSSSFLGVAGWYHGASDPSGALYGPSIVTAGTTPYTCSLGAIAGTGNSAGVTTVRDPLDPTSLWVSEQYANDSGDCHWDTRIVQYRP
jgi:hypothetical protein